MNNNELKLWKYSESVDKIPENRKILLSKYHSTIIDKDLKWMGFQLARYKFAAAMCMNKSNARVLELGSNDGLGTWMLSQVKNCSKIVGIDFDDDAIRYAKETFASDKIVYVLDDFLGKDYRSILNGCEQIGDQQVGYNAIVSLDVIEHIPQEKEELFLKTLSVNLSSDGVAIIGTPNITMTPYASEGSKVGHVNLFDQSRLYDFLSQVFQNVFIFGMTDEVVHTGFYPMCCYIFAVCAGKNKGR